MTGEVVNLRKARKRNARQKAETDADANRLTHGISKAERRLAEAARALSGNRLDGHRRASKTDEK
jgi:hypothetical protein